MGVYWTCGLNNPWHRITGLEFPVDLPLWSFSRLKNESLDFQNSSRHLVISTIAQLCSFDRAQNTYRQNNCFYAANPDRRLRSSLYALRWIVHRIFDWILIYVCACTYDLHRWTLSIYEIRHVYEADSHTVLNVQGWSFFSHALPFLGINRSQSDLVKRATRPIFFSPPVVLLSYDGIYSLIRLDRGKNLDEYLALVRKLCENCGLEIPILKRRVRFFSCRPSNSFSLFLCSVPYSSTIFFFCDPVILVWSAIVWEQNDW